MRLVIVVTDEDQAGRVLHRIDASRFRTIREIVDAFKLALAECAWCLGI